LTHALDLGQPARMSKIEENDSDQQPIQRVIGRRVSPPLGRFPSAAARAAMDSNLNYLTRVPKGIFAYKNHDEMTRDRERWTLEAMLARQSERG
jgi:hypothetical protein